MDIQTIYENVQQFLEENPLPEDHIYRVTDTKISTSDVLALVSCAIGRWYTEGERAKEFRKFLSRITNTRYTTLVNSGSSANLLALTALKDLYNSRNGSKVITCATAFSTTVTPIIQNNLIPLFIDIKSDTLTYDLEIIFDLLERKDVSGIILAHALGFPYQANVIASKCKVEGKWFIGDACDALGSRIYGKPVGSFGDASTNSFFPAHTITSAEGGSVQTSNAQLYRLMQQYNNWSRSCWCAPGDDNTCGKRFSHEWDTGLPYGYDHKYTFTKIGYNLKMTELQAALGLSQIQRLPEIVRKRQENYQRIFYSLTPYYDDLTLYELPVECSPFGFPILTNSKQARRELVTYLESKNIRTRPLFSGNILKHPMMQGQKHEVADMLVGSDIIMERLIWIGCHPYMTEENFKMLDEALKEYFK